MRVLLQMFAYLWACFTKWDILLQGMYTGVVSCIVKLPDEVFVGNAKRVGENKRVMQLLVFRSEAHWYILEKKYNVV